MVDQSNSPASVQGVSSADDGPPLQRIGAVARMLRMPVTTLRVWEQRYGLTQARQSPSGQRRYSADDVRRLALIKQLTELGHAIGSLAPLDMAGLQQVASTHAGALSVARAGTDSAPGAASARPWRVALVGAAWGARLQRPALLRRLERPVQLLGQFDSMAQAAASLKKSADLDALLIHEPQLHAGWLAGTEAAAPALAAVPKAVIYGFAADAVCESLASVGVTLLRDPQPDAVVAQWLNHVAADTAPAPSAQPPAGAGSSEPPRRWDDAALMDFASRSTTVACECPRHVAELLVQLAHFERYSAECENRNTADAQLHQYLRQVATDARTRFEAALERVALHEGLLLPAPSTAPRPVPATWSTATDTP
jgi:MerR family transcriptional regulator, light-induced transcriptional regulator